MSTGDKRIEIKGTAYRLRPWAYEDGASWLFRLTQVAIGGMGQHASENAAIAAVLSKVTEKDFAELRAVCAKYTELVVRSDEGVEEFVQLKESVHLRGKYGAMVALLKAHIEAEFADFFVEIDGLIDRESAKGSST